MFRIERTHSKGPGASGIDQSKALEDSEIVGITGDQLLDPATEERGGKQGVRDSLPSESMSFNQLKSPNSRLRIQADALHVGMFQIHPGHGQRLAHGNRRVETPGIGHDMHKLVKDGGCNDEGYSVTGELIGVPPILWTPNEGAMMRREVSDGPKEAA